MTQRGCTLLFALVLAIPHLRGEKPAAVSSLQPGDLTEFETLGAREQEVLRYALELTRKGLRYQYGSNQPANGGMDCSGTVSHVLNHCGIPAPRMAHLIYLWAKDAGTLVPVRNCHALTDPQLARLRPGDLLFWEGTYDIGERNPPISHVMFFLGHETSNGRAVMVGASSGRQYAGRARHGVSVFDFVMPRAGAESKFVAYSRIPGLSPQSGSGQSTARPHPAPAAAAKSSPAPIPPSPPGPAPERAPPPPSFDLDATIKRALGHLFGR